MSSFIVYSCHCCNIKIHLSSKYTKENFEQLKKEAAVQTPVSGWEFELGMGGIVTVSELLINQIMVSGEQTKFHYFSSRNSYL